ncbi:TetR/AcrR family transcriptional regulator [Corallococcus sp. H22C18031201]|uniref:TetR/AcrR family transcriptional regulator n=1 Tax=Citreicoccus inhibens TaxID=2849499 RepID=UPI000E731F01|nr:TetR/AcrR family transcriptional regulator [Citreicoccus inhibens]MBU8898486.1 TetR/AcrR family transcriptional regulator [Citreicoccus inhibens]RJS21330.1 TetR/AcrR family transcriptional regulator [Corallococcus sp. H22C18031201]
MAEDEGLRARKRRETRKMISDVATGLFVARGFDAVTVAEVAAAANVSKMTVFNYFPRKEDLFFDRQEEGIALLRQAFRERRKGASPVAVLRALARSLVESDHAFARMNAGVAGFWHMVEVSPALRARLREMGEEAEAVLVEELTGQVGAPREDPIARLLAAQVVAAIRVAYSEGLRQIATGEAPEVARAAVVELFERGLTMMSASARGTPYA